MPVFIAHVQCNSSDSFQFKCKSIIGLFDSVEDMKAEIQRLDNVAYEVLDKNASDNKKKIVLSNLRVLAVSVYKRPFIRVQSQLFIVLTEVDGAIEKITPLSEEREVDATEPTAILAVKAARSYYNDLLTKGREAIMRGLCLPPQNFIDAVENQIIDYQRIYTSMTINLAFVKCLCWVDGPQVVVFRDFKVDDDVFILGDRLFLGNAVPPEQYSLMAYPLTLAECSKDTLKSFLKNEIDLLTAMTSNLVSLPVAVDYDGIVKHENPPALPNDAKGSHGITLGCVQSDRLQEDQLPESGLFMRDLCGDDNEDAELLIKTLSL